MRTKNRQSFDHDTANAVFETALQSVHPHPFTKIRQLGLESKVAELVTDGYTVVRPHEFNDRGLTERIRGALLRASERRNGVEPDFEGGTTHSMTNQSTGEQMFYVLLEDPVFEEAIMHEVPLTLITYLLGENILLSSLSGMLRGPGSPALDLHTDMLLAPSQYPAYAQVANATWTLTNYSVEDGSTCFWPGSHKFCRRPVSSEVADTSNLVPVVAPPGSLIIWHGNTWHGSLARKNAGLRMQLIAVYCRSYFFPHESYREKISPEALARNDPKFHDLLGLNHPFPFNLSGYDPVLLSRGNAYRDV